MLASSAARPFRRVLLITRRERGKRDAQSEGKSEFKSSSETALLFTWTLLFWQTEGLWQAANSLLPVAGGILQMASFIFLRSAVLLSAVLESFSRCFFLFCKRNKLQVHTVYFLSATSPRPVAVELHWSGPGGIICLRQWRFLLGVLLANGM